MNNIKMDTDLECSSAFIPTSIPGNFRVKMCVMLRSGIYITPVLCSFCHNADSIPPFLLKEKVEPKVQGEFDAVTELC